MSSLNFRAGSRAPGAGEARAAEGNPGVPHAVLTALLLAVAGIVAGIIGTTGGITPLAAYPALRAAGIAPQAANVTNSAVDRTTSRAQIARFGVPSGGHPADQVADHNGGSRSLSRRLTPS